MSGHLGGETDLEQILAAIRISQREGTFTYLALDPDDDIDPVLFESAHATVAEEEGLTLVVPTGVVRDVGHEVGLEMVWLTIEVHTTLDGVGLTKTFSAALANDGISCNVLAGAFHDHVLVPAADAERALDVLTSLRTGGEPEVERSSKAPLRQSSSGARSRGSGSGQRGGRRRGGGRGSHR